MESIPTGLFVAVALAAVVPLLTRTKPGQRVPAVVLLLLGGVAIGPEGLDWADPLDLQLFANVGLGFLFLLAGYETNLAWFARRSGKLALLTWVVSLVIALAATAALVALDLVSAYGLVALALTTTALGTVLPILRESEMLSGRFREFMLAAGAVGELLPVLAVAIFLGSAGFLVSLLSLLAIGIVAYVLGRLGRRMQGTAIERLALDGTGATSQTTLRLTIALLFGLLVLSADVGVDIVVGAFVAGLVLQRWGTPRREVFDAKLDVVGYGLFIPIFFISSGTTLDVAAIVEAPGKVLIFFALLLLARGLPTYVIYRRDLMASTRLQLALFSSTSLPLLVAIAHLGVQTGAMESSTAAALIGAGGLSVIVFPLLASAIHGRSLDQRDFVDHGAQDTRAV